MKPKYFIRGKVRGGEKRGKALGFPTANLSLHQQIPEGVYTSKVKIQGKFYIAATFIGRAKTFGDKKYQVEAHILDFERNIYGVWISIYLYKKIRGNKKFASKYGLIKQMKKDVLQTRDFFSRN